MERRAQEGPRGGGGNLSQEAASIIDLICMGSAKAGEGDGQKLKPEGC